MWEGMLIRLTSPFTGGSYGSSIPVKPVFQKAMIEARIHKLIF